MCFDMCNLILGRYVSAFLIFLGMWVNVYDKLCIYQFTFLIQNIFYVSIKKIINIM